jgi:hypothetical protein
MRATDLLEKQHRIVEKLFAQFEDARSEETKRDLFERIAANLVAHAVIEREIFLPACEREVRGVADLLKESVVEHGLVEFCVFRADKNRRSDKLDAHVKVLKDVVLHHAEEAEHHLLPNVRKKLSKARDEALGMQLEARFQEVMRGDFRAPLRSDLEQVLSGRAKTAPGRVPSPGGRMAPKRTVAKARATSATRTRAQAPRKRTTGRRRSAR